MVRGAGSIGGRRLGPVTDLGQLLRLLYGAHRAVDAAFLEVRDWTKSEMGHVLIVQAGADGRRQLRWAAGNPWPEAAETYRRVWFDRSGRVRVEVIVGGRTVRVGVRDRTTWWRWDREEGEHAGDVSQGASLPPLLDPPLLDPARILHTMWLDVDGVGVRAEREVVKAVGLPRAEQTRAGRRFEFEFDRQHGTPLYLATADDDGEYVSRTEVLSVDYDVELDAELFSFDKPDDGGTSAPPRPRPVAAASAASRSARTLPSAVLGVTKTVWLTGVPGAGKTTIAYAVERLLRQVGASCCVLDDDDLMAGLCSDLGMSRADRAEHARRLAHIATTLIGAGIIPIVAFVCPDAEDRVRAREIHSAARVGFLEVWVDTPLSVCETRNGDGPQSARLTAATTAEAVRGCARATGPTEVVAPYEVPSNPDLRVSGCDQHPRETAREVLEHIFSSGPSTAAIAVS